MKKPKITTCEIVSKFIRLACNSSEYDRSQCDLHFQISSRYVEHFMRYEGKTKKSISHNDVLVYS
jgi:hypothetical protein